MQKQRAEDLKSEIAFVRDRECLDAIAKIRTLLQSVAVEPEMLRLMTVPMLYSVWERAFSSWTAICLKVIQECSASAKDCPPLARAYWLRKADFFRSFVDSMRDVMELDKEDSIAGQAGNIRRTTKKGTFNLSGKILTELDRWHEMPLKASHDHKDLVITYANVNESVVKTNAEAIGLHELASYSSLDLSELSKLVGMRNDIGHGGVLAAPGPRAVLDLLDYTERLLRQYAEVAIEWISEHEEASMN